MRPPPRSERAARTLDAEPARRACLRCLGLAGAALLVAPSALREALRDEPTLLERGIIERRVGGPGPAGTEPAGAEPSPRAGPETRPETRAEDSGRPNPEKQRRFDDDFPDDILLSGRRRTLVQQVVERLDRAQRWIGHGHFGLLGLDELLLHARRASEIGAFLPEETDLLEEIFHTDASLYGFFGEKVLDELTASLAQRDVQKIAGRGQYLFRGTSLEQYRRIRRDVGTSVILTSGVRGLVKQFHLFLAKTVEAGGNLSRAARSLAPPGYSYHAAGDFDLGTIGLGADNFTDRFARTEEYRRLLDLGYVDIRYPESNPHGVRFEPWHVRVA